jgi:hypothetical protein
MGTGFGEEEESAVVASDWMWFRSGATCAGTASVVEMTGAR